MYHVCHNRQEGWRLEHEVTEDADSPIIFKGIVFNEMKGVFVSEDSLCFIVMLYVIWPFLTSFIYGTYEFISELDHMGFN